MRRVLVLLTAVATLVPAGRVGATAALPETIPLDGVSPEGVAISPDGELFAGSLADGTIVTARLRNGSVTPLVTPDDERVAVGLALDRFARHLFVAGGGPALTSGTGEGFLYDADTGAELAVYDFDGGFVNDVTVTREAAWFTDSFAPVLYRVPIAADGTPGETFDTVELDVDVDPNQLGLNGITATPDGGTLIVVDSTAGQLYRIDAATGTAKPIPLDQPVTFGDGILLHGRRLYVVRNQLNQVAVIRLAGDLSSGRIEGTITDEDLSVPTTIDRFGSVLYAVNAGFGPGPYQAVRLPLRP